MIKTKLNKDARRSSDDAARKILFEHRILLLTEPIDSLSARELNENLMALDCIKKGPILMKINCPGGSIEDGLSIIDTMNELRSNVHTEVCGTAASMATAIALAGDKRLITANSHMMFHEMARYCADYYSKEKHRFKFEEKLWLSMRQFYIRKTKFTSADMSLIDTGELWLSAKECLAKGIVDDVVGETWS